MPRPGNPEDELESEPWFYVDDSDVFPEEFQRFLGLSGHLRDLFMEYHSDLFEPEFWRRAQDALRVDDSPHIIPYAESKRQLWSFMQPDAEYRVASDKE